MVDLHGDMQTMDIVRVPIDGARWLPVWHISIRVQWRDSGCLAASEPCYNPGWGSTFARCAPGANHFSPMSHKDK